ncbi:hypothetical protein BDY19DRAFT_972716 [Irpex rosettiformis]|uniref:Uncharacterized protein n=1 Tax=Irpex rosettiformis TaxID=378272 RepID=A0ACB8TQB9_9APHY|nr:hypothetical protein BDY19DRAFT_972716 [Irpex rosettiformis]
MNGKILAIRSLRCTITCLFSMAFISVLDCIGGPSILNVTLVRSSTEVWALSVKGTGNQRPGDWMRSSFEC